MRLVSSAAMQEIDRRTQDEYGVPELVLMESAGLRAWDELQTRVKAIRPPASICFVAGRGNNGGDALVMARYAALGGFPVRVVLAAEERSLGEQGRLHAGILRNLQVPVCEWPGAEAECRNAIASSGVIVDGLAGTGIRGELRAPLDAMCAAINASGACVAAVDAPSGLSEQWRSGMPVVQARWTLTMGLPKTCLYTPSGRAHCGEIVAVPLSFPTALIDDPALPGELLGPCDLERLVQPLNAGDYKTRRGVVAVVGGAIGTTGAPVLAADAAARCRAGLVTIFADGPAHHIVASLVRSVMVRPLDALQAALERTDAVVVGPGWGTDDSRGSQLEMIVQGARRGVIDADGLNLLAGDGAARARNALHEQWVLTPHPGELARLLKADATSVTEELFEASGRLAARTGAVVVGKASVTVVAHPDGRFAVIDGMNAAMGTGGSGDVLAGAIGGLLAGGMDGWTAARAAALVHQQAGRSLRGRVGLFLAEQLPAEIGRIVDVGGASQR